MLRNRYIIHRKLQKEEIKQEKIDAEVKMRLKDIKVINPDCEDVFR